MLPAAGQGETIYPHHYRIITYRYRIVTGLLPDCYRIITYRYRIVTGSLPDCYRIVTGLLPDRYRIRIRRPKPETVSIFIPPGADFWRDSELRTDPLLLTRFARRLLVQTSVLSSTPRSFCLSSVGKGSVIR